MTLSDKARAMLEIVHRPDKPRFEDLSVDEARRAFDKMSSLFSSSAALEQVDVRDIEIDRDDGSVLAARLYRPKRLRERETLPVTLYYHGGGWCVGNVASYDGFCASLAVEAACAVLSVEYRLAPEHPFPHGLEDARHAFEWVRAQGSRFGLSRRRIALAGDSAGATLAIVTALSLRDGAGASPLFLCLIYPCVQILSERPSRLKFGEGYFLDNGSMAWFFSRYLPDGNDEDWRASPLNADSLAGLPPMMLITAEYDPLSDDAAAFAERVRGEGGAIEHIAVAGMIHGFLPFDNFFPEAVTLRKRIAAALHAALTDAGGG